MSDTAAGTAADDASLQKRTRRPSVRVIGRDRRRGRPGPARPSIAQRWRGRVRDFYQHYLIELILRRKALPPSKDGRHIPLRVADSHEKPLIDERRGHPYVSNVIRTSRYTVYDFFPKQLLFQFSRLGNFYFLCVGIPQTIPGLSTTGSYTTILPLLFFVLLTIAKEGFDDWKRHRLDTVENSRTAKVLRPEGDVGPDAARWWLRLSWLWAWRKGRPEGPVEESKKVEGVALHWVPTKWRDIRVGDVIKLARDEDVPADIVLLHADGENGLAYIETMALDGETNLKSKQVSTALESCGSVEGIAQCRAEFVMEDPNPDLFRFDGRVTVGDKTLPLTLNEVVYRGCTLRNTPCAIGMVINTGEECKIRRNANRHPNAKKPALERISNKIVISLAIFVVCLTVGCSMGYLIWQSAYEDNAWYLEDASVPFQEIIVGFAIQFNNVIPLALYVSLEIVKIGQMIMLNSDIEMYDEATDTSAKCNTNTILENLGQIGYVFSDKTGTLTDNIMKFRKMSIAGTVWLHEMDIQPEETAQDEKIAEVKTPTSLQRQASNARSVPIPFIEIEEPDISAVEAGLSPVRSPTSPSLLRRSSSHWRSTGRPDHVQPDVNTSDLLEFIRARPHSPFSKRAVQYILALALCHTCLPEVKDGRVHFQAASPDEVALVTAAQELGFLVVQRSSQMVTVQISDGSGIATQQVYEILDVIEFSSKRKRMTILVRCPDSRIWLIIKGADSVILPRLRMAHLAMQKANELRESLELEHELQRKSEAREPRNSFGGKPSLTVRRSAGLSPGGPVVAGPSSRRSGPARSMSFEVNRRPQLGIRTTSFDGPAPALLSPVSPVPLPEKFAFLDDPSVYDDGHIFTQCFKHIDDFATEGLRTLLFAHKFLSEQEYKTWKKLYHDAETSLVDRQERVEAAGDIIEQSLDLIGASAIEDKLQKGVPETIDRLRRANIKIWMLTGDKRETALNIAHSARICRPGSEIYILDVAKGALKTQLINIMEDLQVQAETASAYMPSHSVVVIDGHTLAAIEEPDALTLRDLFYTLIPNIDSVICCRASPAQKALLVRAIRKSASSPQPIPSLFPSASEKGKPHPRFLFGLPRVSTGPLTLAIGDGANDLAMLSEAHVGVGISGREGLQAARVADYSIAQFRFLARLLLVHGRWNYSRTARFILATFWKEMFFYLPTALYQRCNGYTGTSLYESWSLTVLNTLFTSLCTVVPGIWEQDLSATTLMAVPELYVFGQRDKGLNVPKYVFWMVGAISEGLLVWFLSWALYGGLATIVGDNGLFALGNLVFTTAIMWTNGKLMLLDTHHKTYLDIGACLLTISGWWAWQGFLSGLYSTSPSPYAVHGGFASGFGRDPAWWLTLVIVLALLASLELAYRAVKRGLIVSGLWKWGWKWLSWRTWKTAFRGAWAKGDVGEGNEKKSVEDWEVELWQELEQRAELRLMLERMARLGDGEDGLEEGVVGVGNGDGVGHGNLVEGEGQDGDGVGGGGSGEGKGKKVAT